MDEDWSIRIGSFGWTLQDLIRISEKTRAKYAGLGGSDGPLKIRIYNLPLYQAWNVPRKDYAGALQS